MRAEALRQLQELRWLEETERHRDQLRVDADADPTNIALRDLLQRLDQVIASEWRRLNPAQRSHFMTGEHRISA